MPNPGPGKRIRRTTETPPQIIAASEHSARINELLAEVYIRADRAISGRPTILTPDLERSILRDILAGNYIETVMSAHCISDATMWNWKTKALKPDTCRDGEEHRFYHLFWSRIKSAHSVAEMELVRHIREHGDPSACLRWILERTRNARYRQVQSIEVTQDVTVTSYISSPAPPEDHGTWLSQAIATLHGVATLPATVATDAEYSDLEIEDGDALERIG